MRFVLLLSLFAASVHLSAQTPPPAPPPATPPATEQPKPVKPAPRPAQPAARTVLMITATDPTGATIPGVHVEVLGAADRQGDTDANGTLRLANMRAGTYRVRFSSPDIITLEREVTVRSGQTTELDVTLNRAPPAPEPEPAPAQPAPAAAAPAGPAGEPKVLSILDLLEKEFVGRQPRKETRLGCSGNMRSSMIQLNETQPERLYENAESAYYVLGGEGTVRLSGRESAIVTGNFVVVPRGVSHSFIRKGRRPLILLFVLSGEPCEATP